MGPDTAAFRSAGTTACGRRTGIGLTGSRCWLLLRRPLRLGLLNLRLLSCALRGERIVVNGNERIAVEIRLIVYRHQRIIRHDESPTVFADTIRMGP